MLANSSPLVRMSARSLRLEPSFDHPGRQVSVQKTSHGDPVPVDSLVEVDRDPVYSCIVRRE